jgi:phosphatidate cytidylyltransferase
VPTALLDVGIEPGPVHRGPVWRESSRDFDDDYGFADIAEGGLPLGGETEEQPEENPATEASPPEEAVLLPLPSQAAEAASRTRADAKVHFRNRSTRPRHGVAPAERERKQRSARAGRNPVVATATGVLIGAATLGCFLAGPAAVLGLASLVFLVAAAELVRAMKGAQLQPATPVVVVAAPGIPIAAYLLGPSWLPLVAAGAVVAALVWYLGGRTRQQVTTNVSVTILAVGWIALLGSFAGLLLDPTAFPARHGLAYLLGAIEATVAYDVAGYAVGSVLGRHRLAPKLSPNKTWEGLVAGSVSAFLVAFFVVSQMSPWTMPRAAVLGVAVAFLAPLGDLAESMLKRDLNVKDMGRLLPAHGGVLDRIDGLLFALPATYLLVRLFHG